MKLTQKIAIVYIRLKLKGLSLLSPRKAAEKALDIFSTPFLKVKKKAPAVFEKAEQLSLKTEGNLIKGFRWNHDEKTDRKKILILHGFQSSAKNFDHFIHPLVDKHYEILAFDAPAHGESSGKQLNLLTYIQTIQDIVNQHGPIHGFIAHSVGGLALTHYLEKAKQDTQRKVVLIAPATETSTAIDFFFSFLKLNKKVKEAFNHLIEEKTGVQPTYFSIRRAIKNIQASVLWIHDEDDDITPLKDVLKVLNDHPSGVTFYFTKGLGHRRIYRDPHVVTRVLDFF